MAIPNVFVSSTWYDLRYIRENLKYLIKTLGYNPILSEEGGVYYDPAKHTTEAAVAEVGNAQLFVLIIGGRYGSTMPTGEISVTNAEYEEAVTRKIPIFALVEQGALSDYSVFEANRESKAKVTRITFPNVDSVPIFDFIEQVRGQAVNNALVPFRDFADIEAYLRQQWAAMMHAFLTRLNEEQRVTDTLGALTDINQRIEFLSKEILKSVGDKHAQLALRFYDLMIGSRPVRDLGVWGVRPTPTTILINSTFRSCSKSLGVNLQIQEDREGYSIGGSGTISRPMFDRDSNEYKDLRRRMTDLLKEEGMSIEDFVKGAP